MLCELFKKLLINIIPVEYKLFANKFLKFKEIDANDTIDMVFLKLEENYEMCENHFNLLD